MVKKYLVSIMPPIVYKAVAYIFRRRDKSGELSLFNGDDEYFKKVATGSRVYAEYGCGESTLWIAKNTSCKIYSVDTSRAWVDKTVGGISRSDVSLHWVDVGDLGDWGRPLGFEKREGFYEYFNWVWEQGDTPDLVLIDGRFRVCCFLTSLFKAEEGTTIIFDDYKYRRHYHIVEHFLTPIGFCGRQAIFVVPDKGSLDIDELSEYIRNFSFVFD